MHAANEQGGLLPVVLPLAVDTVKEQHWWKGADNFTVFYAYLVMQCLAACISKGIQTSCASS